MPPPSTPPPSVPTSHKAPLPFSVKSHSFREKAKLPYSASFAELQGAQSGKSFGTEFNNEYDPLGNLHYGSFKEPTHSSKAFPSFQGGPPTTPQKPEYLTPYNNASGEYQQTEQHDYIKNYEEYGGDYQQAAKYPHNNDYGYYNNYSHYGVDNGYNQGNEDPQNEENYQENPYWKWDSTLGWVPKEDYYQAPIQDQIATPPIPKSLSRRLSSGHGIARKKSSSKKSRNGSGSFGETPSEFEAMARKGSSPQMVNMAFSEENGSVQTPQAASNDDVADELLPKSSLTKKKQSLWG